MIQVVPFIIIIIIILSKLSLGKENISCSYAVMPNCGRRSKQVGPHKYIYIYINIMGEGGKV